MDIFIDLKPGEDERFIIAKRANELAKIFTGYCMFCSHPTTHLITWKPDADSRLALHVPPGTERVYFFPTCHPCSMKQYAEEELQWKTIEGSRVNVPLEDGHKYFH